MRFEVKGADASTGTERVTTFEAPDEKQAAALANYNGIMVESVKRIDVGVPVSERTLDYRGSKSPSPPPPVEPKPVRLPSPAAMRRRLEWACITLGERVMYKTAGVIGFLLTASGIIAWFSGASSPYAAEHPEVRFITDNAIGASANAAELANSILKYRLEQIHWDVVTLVGVMFLLLSALIRHRGTVRAGTMSP